MKKSEAPQGAAESIRRCPRKANEVSEVLSIVNLMTPFLMVPI